MPLVNLLVIVIVLCLVFWAVNYLTAAFGLDARVKAVIVVLMVVIAVLWLLGALTGNVPTLRLG